MKTALVSTLLATALLATIAPAGAATRTVFINGSDLYESGGPPANAAGASLSGTASSTITINLTLPKGFKSNSTATLQLRMLGGGTSCGVVLAAGGAVRLRPGAVAEIAPSPASGLTIVAPGTFVTPAAVNQVFTKKFKLAPPVSGTGQKTGDTVFVVISRDGGGAGDTCAGALFVTSVKFTYQLP